MENIQCLSREVVEEIPCSLAKCSDYQNNNKSETNMKAEKIARINQRLVDFGCLSYNNKICYLTEDTDISKAANDLLKWIDSQSNVKPIPVALDIEYPWTRKTGGEKTALIQLCFTIDVCYLFHVSKLEKLPDAFVTLLHHPKLFFHGNYVARDIRKIQEDFPNIGNVENITKNCCELNEYANKVLRTNINWSLDYLSKEFLNLNIAKDRSIRAGNWDRNLNEQQQIYAAIDVYASQLIYQKIKEIEEKQS